MLAYCFRFFPKCVSFWEESDRYAKYMSNQYLHSKIMNTEYLEGLISSQTNTDPVVYISIANIKTVIGHPKFDIKVFPISVDITTGIATLKSNIDDYLKYTLGVKPGYIKYSRKRVAGKTFKPWFTCDQTVMYLEQLTLLGYDYMGLIRHAEWYKINITDLFKKDINEIMNSHKLCTSPDIIDKLYYKGTKDRGYLQVDNKITYYNCDFSFPRHMDHLLTSLDNTRNGNWDHDFSIMKVVKEAGHCSDKVSFPVHSRYSSIILLLTIIGYIDYVEVVRESNDTSLICHYETSCDLAGSILMGVHFHNDDRDIIIRSYILGKIKHTKEQTAYVHPEQLISLFEKEEKFAIVKVYNPDKDKINTNMLRLKDYDLIHLRIIDKWTIVGDEDEGMYIDMSPKELDDLEQCSEYTGWAYNAIEGGDIDSFAKLLFNNFVPDDELPELIENCYTEGEMDKSTTRDDVIKYMIKSNQWPEYYNKDIHERRSNSDN